MVSFIIPEGYEGKYCVWENYNRCLDGVILGVADTLKELDEKYPDSKYPRRLFGTTLLKKQEESGSERQKQGG